MRNIEDAKFGTLLQLVKTSVFSYFQINQLYKSRKDCSMVQNLQQKIFHMYLYHSVIIVIIKPLFLNNICILSLTLNLLTPIVANLCMVCQLL